MPKPPVRYAWLAATRDAAAAAAALRTQNLTAVGRRQRLITVGYTVTRLASAIHQLWRMKESQDVNWRTILNHAQGLLCNVEADLCAGVILSPKFDAMRTIVTRYLRPGEKAIDDLHAVVDLIAAAGCDPYAAISGDPDA